MENVNTQKRSETKYIYLGEDKSHKTDSGVWLKEKGG